MTAFTRNDGSGTAVNNSYTFNHLFQLTNQTVTKGGTTLQNLTYNFSSTQNNGQILSQIDAVSGETVEYAYDSLNRLLTAATTGPQWGLSFTYDGFGNRTNQSVTKGSGPTHSVAIDPATNRISTSGYQYDPNGNMTQMPQLTMSYDVANRMTTSNHASAGTQVYGYNHANQRVFVRNGNTVTYYLYGLGGERLMEFQETCTSGACGGYTETQRWIYFTGRKMFSKTGSTLKAVTPNRLASEANHFPYGETDGTPPSETKDYFTTYRRDGTGLDYAWNRYYSPTMGRFTTADPYEASAALTDPQTWNRYVYLDNDPANGTDRRGLLRDFCEDLDESPEYCYARRPNPFQGGFFNPVFDREGTPIAFVVKPYFYNPQQGGGGFASKYSKCNPSNSPHEDKNLDFVKSTYSTAKQASEKAGIPVSWVLSWAASESGWGRDSKPLNNGNYYGLTTGANWLDQSICPAGASSAYACFGSFADSTNAALFSSRLTLTGRGEAPSRIRWSAAELLKEQYSAGNSMSTSFQKLAEKGHDPLNSNYGSNVANTNLSSRLDCLLENGYIK
jgi:RHS repeat-associated protein